MTTPADWTPEEAGNVEQYMPEFRSALGRLASTMQYLEALDDLWVAEVSPIITALDTGVVIPRYEGLAQSSDMKKGELQNLRNSIRAMLDVYNTPDERVKYVRAAGVDRCSRI